MSDALAPYFTPLHSIAVTCDEGTVVADSLHPEWTSVRFNCFGTLPRARVISNPMQTCPPFCISGPTSRAVDFETGTSCSIGFSILPAGWARFANQSAASLTNSIVPGGETSFKIFSPIMDLVRAAGDDLEAAATAIDGFLLELEARAPPVLPRVLACQEALKDADLNEVEDLVARVGTSRRSLERLCSHYFGFPPKTLLRRQRFLRSLARFMLDSCGSWSRAVDSHYFDQAHFVRDFRAFMGRTPSEYAEMPHPVLDMIIAQQMVDQGAVTQSSLPTLVRYANERVQ